MYRSNYGHALRTEEIRGLSQQDALAKLVEYVEQWKYTDEWRTAIVYLIKNE